MRLRKTGLEGGEEGAERVVAVECGAGGELFMGTSCTPIPICKGWWGRGGSHGVELLV